MGARIFIRHARGYTLTELGEDVLAKKVSGWLWSLHKFRMTR
jgi:hypothetical protein